MFRNEIKSQSKERIAIRRVMSLALFVGGSLCAGYAPAAKCQLTSEQTAALRYTSKSEVARLPAPAFSLLFFLTPPAQRTPFECASIGSFKDWARNRRLWTATPKYHYYDVAKRYVSVSDWPTDPHPEQFDLSSTDVQFMRTLVALSSGSPQPGSSSASHSDLEKMMALLGTDFVEKLVPDVSGGDVSSEGESLRLAFWRGRRSIAAGTKLFRSITLVNTSDNRRLVRLLNVLQIGRTLLPLEACYYSAASDDVDLKYSEGLPVPSGGLGFVPTFVGIPLYVYVLDGGPPVEEVAKAVRAAAAIWKRAGIVLSPTINTVDKKQTIAILGKDERIGMFFDCKGRFREPEFSARERLSELKPSKDSLAVYFGNVQRTQSEPELVQAYIGYDPNQGTPGLTIAHEIGHLFFGAGHVGGKARGPCLDESDDYTPKKPVAITSALMESPQETSEIDDQDAMLAKQKMLARADARWW